MREIDVPQDGGLNQGLKEITYAVAENGRYVVVPSLGWEPKNIANAQAWEVISEDIRTQARRVLEGELSPLAYHLARNLMTAGLAASYVRLPRWRVKRHLKPSVFNRLKPEILQRYADLLGLSLVELKQIPLADVNMLGDEQL
ncbi:hypothetical protein BAC2_03528 [uncultured bacterium]|nr:hypothetical protein BAC2_03528 [uncultured bacterium]